MRLYGTFDPSPHFLSFEQNSFDTKKMGKPNLSLEWRRRSSLSSFFGGQKDPLSYSSFRFLYSFLGHPILDPLNQCCQQYLTWFFNQTNPFDVQAGKLRKALMCLVLYDEIDIFLKILMKNVQFMYRPAKFDQSFEKWAPLSLTHFSNLKKLAFEEIFLW